MDKIKVGIIGAGGYGGCGAMELLQNHPHAEIGPSWTNRKWAAPSVICTPI